MVADSLKDIDHALARGRLSEALQHAAAALERNPDNVRLLAKKASLLQNLYRDVDAATVLDRALELAPNDFSLRLHRASLASTLGDSQRAEALYEANLALNPSHPETWLARLDAALLSEAPARHCRDLASKARARFEAVILQGKSKPDDYYLALGDLAFRMRDWQRALGIWRSIGLDENSRHRRSLQAAQCHMLLLNEPLARQCLETLLAATPASISALQLLSDLELSCGHGKRSMDLRLRMFALEGLHRLPLGLRLVQDLLLLGERDQAAEVRRQCEALPHERLEIGYARLLMNEGRPQEAWEYAAPWQDCAGQSPLVAQLFDDLGHVLGHVQSPADPEASPARFRPKPKRKAPEAPRPAAEVHALFLSQEPTPADVLIMRQNLRLAWQVRDDHDIPYDTWLETAFRAASGNRLLAPDPQVSAQEIAQLMVPADFDVLLPFAEQSGPVLLACSHQGPFMQHVMALYFPKLRFATMGTTTDESGQPDSRNFPLHGGRGSAAVGLVRALRKGETVILPVDNGSLSFVAGKSISAAHGKLFSVPVSIPDTIPRLAREFDIPSFWVYCYWQEDRVRYDIQRLPDPIEGEGKQAWHDRWAEAYLKRLETAMRGSAQNININAPMWRYLLLNGDKTF